MEANSSQNESNVSTDTLSRTKCTLYLSEGVGWIGSVLVLIPYVIPVDKTVDFVSVSYTHLTLPTILRV